MQIVKLTLAWLLYEAIIYVNQVLAEMPYLINPDESNSNYVEYKVCKEFAKF